MTNKKQQQKKVNKGKIDNVQDSVMSFITNQLLAGGNDQFSRDDCLNIAHLEKRIITQPRTEHLFSTQ